MPYYLIPRGTRTVLDLPSAKSPVMLRFPSKSLGTSVLGGERQPFKSVHVDYSIGLDQRSRMIAGRVSLHLEFLPTLSRTHPI